MLMRSCQLVFKGALRNTKAVNPCGMLIRYATDLQNPSPGAQQKVEADLWAWIPPRDKVQQHELKQTYQLPVTTG
jgi:hypothetical protein